MPTPLPSVGGTEMAAGYRQIFAAVRRPVAPAIDELVVKSDETAHALTRNAVCDA